MFIPMSYRDQDRHNVKMSFPSKLADFDGDWYPAHYRRPRILFGGALGSGEPGCSRGGNR